MKEDLLKYVDLKLKRVFDQMIDLDNQILNWQKKEDIEFKVEIREKRLGYRIVVSECTNLEFFEHWGLLIGEIVHNLRSSLDNLVFALARIQKNVPDNQEQLSFLICKNREVFEKKKLKLSPLIPKEALDLIEKIQPFQRLNPNIDGTPDTDGLNVLNWINIVDKHRVPTVLLIVPINHNQSTKVKYYSEREAELDVPPKIEVFGHPIVKNSIIFEHKTEYPIESVEINLDFNVQVSIQTLNGPEQIAILIPALYNYVLTIVNLFRPFFL